MNKQTTQQPTKVDVGRAGRVITDITPPQHATAGTSKATYKSVKTTALNMTKGRRPQPTQTLMRRSVKRPAPTHKIAIQQQLQHQPGQLLAVRTQTAVDTARLARAQQAQKNSSVNRFYAPSTIPITYTETPVQEPPAQQKAPDTPPPVSTSQFAEMFEHALASANHYVDLAEEKARFKKLTRRHALSMTGGTLLLLLSLGFAAYLNSPSLQMKVAGLRAGIPSATPDFKASGFSYNGVQTDPGKIVYGFTLGTDTYHLTEQTTNWSEKAMLTHISGINVDGTPNYETTSAKDQTIYTFDNGQSTWLKDGVWYQVHGKRTLTDEQLRALVRNT